LSASPLSLRLRGKSTALSHRTPIYYVDLTIREGTTLEEAIRQAKELDKRRREGGFDQHSLDQAAREGLENGSFEEGDDEAQTVAEEFFAPLDTGGPHSSSLKDENKGDTTTLRKKVQRRIADPS